MQPSLQDRLRESSAYPVASDGGAAAALRLERAWDGPVCRARVTNEGPVPVRVREIALFDLSHGLPADTPFYAESFQMLEQHEGTLDAPRGLGRSDREHYRIPEPDGLRTAHNLLLLSPAQANHVLLGFASCHKFIGRFGFDAARLRVSVDTENLELAPGQAWDMEAFWTASGPNRADLLEAFADAISAYHPPLRYEPIPTGWCSWYCFGSKVTAQNVSDNLDFMARRLPELRFVQIDDGYQPHMGDWLDTGASFGGDVRALIADIKARGFEPAIWAAPFIAEKDSRLLHEHPDWFVQNALGEPLDSSEVSFGGWRRGPWFCLDGTHPEAQRHLENVFQTLRREWGCTYFKLDANFWGAIHSGRFFDPHATRIEAYRRGMEAILRGADDAFVLSCNAPLWPSLGLVHGQRTSGDIKARWDFFTLTGRQNLLRAWQNGRLWWNDPDCVLLTGKLSDDEFVFHATLLFAIGGMMLSGDNLPTLTPPRLALLRKLLTPTGRAMRFDDAFSIGRLAQSGREYIAVFNETDAPVKRDISLQAQARLTDFWTDADLGVHEDRVDSPALPPRSARLLIAEPAGGVR